MSTDLGYEIFVAESIPQNTTQLLPIGDSPVWSPLSTTLIHGRTDAVLVDPPHTRRLVGLLALLDLSIAVGRPRARAGCRRVRNRLIFGSPKHSWVHCR